MKYLQMVFWLFIFSFFILAQNVDELTDITNLSIHFEGNLEAYNDAGVTLATNGQTVQLWGDQSSGNLDASQSTESFRALFATDVLGTGDGVDFDGTDNTYPLSAAILTSVGEFSVFLIVKADNNTTLRMSFSEQANVGADSRIYIGNDGTAVYGRAGSNAGDSGDIETGVLVFGTFYIHVLVGGSGTVTSYVNNEAGESGSFSQSVEGVYNMGSFGGTNNFFDGNLAMLVVYDKAVSGLERKQIMDIMANDTYLVSGYSLQALRILSFSPTFGVEDDIVIITGVNFTDVTDVTFGGVAASFVVDNSTTITATVPVGVITGVIVLTDPDETYTSLSNFIVSSGTKGLIKLRKLKRLL